MKRIIVILMVVVILASLAPMSLAAGMSGSGSTTLNLTKPDTGVTDPNLLKPIETPYPPSLNMLFLFIGVAIVIVAAELIAKKQSKKHRSKHRDIYGRW